MKFFLDNLFKGKEGNIFLFGLFLTLSLIVFIIICYQLDVDLANKITGMVFSNLFVGRVPSLSFGYASELSHFVVITTNIITEAILVAIIYPLFVFSFKGILKIKVLENFFNEVQSKKQLHQEKFDKYGKFGLFFFVFIPFWMTGPIVGAIIGFLIGINLYTVIVIVLVATVIAISLWGFFLQEIIDFLLIFDTQLVWSILFVFVIILLFFRFRKKII